MKLRPKVPAKALTWMLVWLAVAVASAVLLTIHYGGGALLLTYFCAGALHNFMEDCHRWAVPEGDQQGLCDECKGFGVHQPDCSMRQQQRLT